MSTTTKHGTNAELFTKLRAPFSLSDLQPALGSKRLEVGYFALMDRLDEVLGPTGWSAHYEEVGESYCCRLQLVIQGELVTKQDTCYPQSSEVRPTETPTSPAFRAACIAFGIGRVVVNQPEATRIEESFPQKETSIRPVEANPKGIDWSYPKAGTSEVFAWVKKFQGHTGVDVMPTISKICRKEGLDSDMKAWSQGTTENICDRMKDFYRKSPEYAGEFE